MGSSSLSENDGRERHPERRSQQGIPAAQRFLDLSKKSKTESDFLPLFPIMNVNFGTYDATVSEEGILLDRTQTFGISEYYFRKFSELHKYRKPYITVSRITVTKKRPPLFH